jgi:hypothetical protein
MTSQNEDNQELLRRVEKRLAEIEHIVNSEEVPFYQTQKHQPEKTKNSDLKTVISAAKFIGFAILGLIAVQMSLFLIRFLIFATLGFLIYKLFLESLLKADKNKNK